MKRFKLVLMYRQYLLLLVTLMGCSTCIAQSITFDSIYVNEIFKKIELSDEQKSVIVSEYNRLGSDPQFRNSGEVFIQGITNLNLLAYENLSEEQRGRFHELSDNMIKSALRSKFHYLNLSEIQKDKIVETMNELPGFDSLRVVRYYHEVPDEMVLAHIDEMQHGLYEKHQEESRIMRENHLRESDAKYLDDVEFETKKLKLIDKLYLKHLIKERQAVLNSIGSVNTTDVSRIEEIRELYQLRVMNDQMKARRLCYSKDSILIAPIKLDLVNLTNERKMILAELCVYWCRFGDAMTSEIKNEKEIVYSTLEYIQTTYKSILDNAINKLRPIRTKLMSKISNENPADKNISRVTIVSDKRTMDIDSIAELLLGR